MGGIANLVLDPLFILPQFLGLGAVGAGMATCLSNVLSVVYFLLCLVRQRNESVIGLHPRHLRHSRKYLGNILAIGFPSACSMPLRWWRWLPSPGSSPSTPPRLWPPWAL